MAGETKKAQGAMGNAQGATPYIWLAGLSALILASAFAVIQSSHQCRQLYAVLQQLEAEQWLLHEDYGRLILEQSTWASHYRVERVATRELDMQAPELREVRVVRP